MSDSGGSFDGAGQLTAAQANAAMLALTARLQSTLGERGAAGEPSGLDEKEAPGEDGAPGDDGASGEPLSGETPGTGGEATAAGPPVAVAAHTTQSPVTVAGFDRMLVEELGLSSVAAHVQASAATAGLDPPPYFGTEVLARMLELRYEHPVGSQRLDLFPGQAITRAEAAWSLAALMSMNDWSVSSAREALSAFELPQMSAAQRQALTLAVSRIGYPYVWGGTTDNTADGLEHGGFDCSGFAWRVFKVSGLPWGKKIRGRTAAEQARNGWRPRSSSPATCCSSARRTSTAGPPRATSSTRASTWGTTG